MECEFCKKTITRKRSTKRFCSAYCRVYAFRMKGKDELRVGSEVRIKGYGDRIFVVNGKVFNRLAVCLDDKVIYEDQFILSRAKKSQDKP